MAEGKKATSYTPAQIRRRDKIVRQVIASSKLEGVKHSAAFERQLNRYVNGEITSAELKPTGRG